LGGTRTKLEALGVETLGITEDSVEPVRRYYRIRPSKLRLATDPDRAVHRSYGVPMPLYAGAYTELRETTRIDPTGELPEPMPIPAAMKHLDEMDGLGKMPEAKAVMDAFAKREYAMHVGHFLVDRSGIVRWTWVESPSPDDVTQYGRLPTDNQILTAVRAAGL
jgi:AhpC/TSA family